MRVKDFINKYSNIILIVLVCLFLLKNCQSCNKQRVIEFNKYNYELVVDSLNNINNQYKIQNQLLKDSIGMYRIEIEQLNDKIDILKGSNKHYQHTNRILVNTNKNLSNKEY